MNRKRTIIRKGAGRGVTGLKKTKHTLWNWTKKIRLRFTRGRGNCVVVKGGQKTKKEPRRKGKERLGSLEEEKGKGQTA